MFSAVFQESESDDGGGDDDLAQLAGTSMGSKAADGVRPGLLQVAYAIVRSGHASACEQLSPDPCVPRCNFSPPDEEDEYSHETVDEKRLRLTKAYLKSVEMDAEDDALAGSSDDEESGSACYASPVLRVARLHRGSSRVLLSFLRPVHFVLPASAIADTSSVHPVFLMSLD